VTCSIDRTAYRRFKPMITTRELADSFTGSNEEIEWARDMTLSAPHLLALTIWLKSYQRLGYFPKPDVVVEQVRDALRLSADVMAEVEATQSAKRHRELARSLKNRVGSACCFAISCCSRGTVPVGRFVALTKISRAAAGRAP